MEGIKNLIENIPFSALVWEYHDNYKKIKCIESNQKFYKSNQNQQVKGLYIKSVIPNFSKKDFSIYSDVIKTNKTMIRTYFTNHQKYQSKIVYLFDNYLAEIFEKTSLSCHLNLYLNDLINMVLIINDDFIIQNVNDLFLKISQYNLENVIDHNVQMFFNDKLSLEKEKQIIQNTFRAKDDINLLVDYYFIKMFDIDSLHYVLIIKDVSPFYKNIIYAKVIEEIDIPIAIFDNSTNKFELYKCIESNKRFKKIFSTDGNPGAECDSRVSTEIDLVDIFSDEIYIKLRKNYKKWMTNGLSVIEQCVFNNNIYNFTCFLIQNQTFGLFLNDITFDENDKEDEISKNTFLSNITKNFKIPINTMLSIINLLSDTELTDRQKNYINTILNSNYQLMALITDVVDYTNLKLNKVELNLQPFNLREEIEDNFDIVYNKTKDKGLEFRLDFDNKIPPYLIGDKDRIKQILMVLLKNAIYHTEKGKIILDIQLQKDKAKRDSSPIKKLISSSTRFLSHQSFQNELKKKHAIIFNITDTGIGISDSQKDNILMSTRKKTIKGKNGLGLTIANGLISLMSGKLEFHSKVNVGTTFYFTLEFEEYTNIEKIEEISVNLLKDKTVIIVSLEIKTRLEISSFIIQWNMEPILLSSLEEGLFYLTNKSNIDILIIDISMMDETLLQNFSNIPVIGIGDTNDSDKFRGILSKPVMKNKLLKLCINIFSEHQIELKRISSAEKEKEKQKISILVGDENKVNQSYIYNTLNKLGYTNIDIVSDGNEYLKKIKHNVYDLHLIDSEISKIEDIIEKIKTTKNSFVVGLTTKDRKKNKNIKVDVYLVKPIDQNELKALLKVITRRIKNK